MRAGRAEDTCVRVYKHHRAGDRRGALDHPGGQGVEGGFHRLAHSQARGDPGQGRDTLFQQPEGLDTLGDVADDGADHLFATVADQARGDLDVYQRTILATVSPLAHEAAPLLQDAPDVPLDALPVVGDEIVDGHAQDLFSGVAQHLLKRGVELQDIARGSLEQEDAFRGLLDHRPVAFFALYQRLPGPLALGDVFDDGDEVLRLSRGGTHKRHRQVDPNYGAGLAEIPLLYRVP